MSLSVNVSIESPDEFQVQEISYDGQEKYVQPLSMSENLTRLAQRIDFGKDSDDGIVAVEKPETIDSESKELTSFQPSLWPWDSVRNKLKNVLTEMTVMCDVMNICKDKKYVVLDPVSQDPNEIKPAAVMLAKKKALAAAATVIINGSERMRSSQSDPSKNRSNDFNAELINMRHNWRLKRVGGSIIGDLSYRSAGSRYPHPGTFEVSKNETAGQITVPLSPHSLPSPRPSPLKVTVSSDLDGVSYIQVSIQTGTETIASGELTIPLPQNVATTLESNWQQKLENAQNVLFCKELFAQLAREAVQVQLPIPTLVVGNEIITTLFPEVQLFIGLCHTTTSTKIRQQDQQNPSKREHKPVLEHSLHQLLRELHYNTLHHPMPHPTTATLGISKKRYLAGPEAYDRQTLINSCKSETILEQIIAQSCHHVLRRRTMVMIDVLASEIKDPIIVGHWMSLNSPTKSSVKINIVSYGYENLYRSPLVIHVESRSLKAICRDGRVINMSYESQELRYLLQSQVSQHQINTVQALAKMMGWGVLSLTINCGVGLVEEIGTASSIILSSPNSDRMIAVRHGPKSGPQVSISVSAQEQDFFPSQLVKDRKWQNLGGVFQEVFWEKMEGKNFINNMEFLMASLTTC